MNFTKEELYEIEKWFDILAGRVAPSLASVLQLEKLKEGKILLDKIAKESLKTFNTHRTISAKACEMRNIIK